MLIPIGLVLAGSAWAQPEAVPYTDEVERAAGWALLLEPLRFEGDVLSPFSAEILADQALTLAANPDLEVTVGVTGADAAETLERIETLERAYAESGVEAGQVRFLPADGADVQRPGPAQDAGDGLAARVLTTEGALAAGAERVPYVVVSWPGAKLFRVPETVYQSNQRNERVFCALPPDAFVAHIPATGRLERRTSRLEGWLVARRGDDLAFDSHVAGGPDPVDLTVALDPSPCD